MKEGSELKIANWAPNHEGSVQFLKDTTMSFLGRISEALSYSWLKEQLMRFKLNRLGSAGTYDLLVKPIYSALSQANYKDLLIAGRISRITIQIQDSLFLTVSRDSDRSKFIATFSKQTGPSFKSTSILFEIHKNGFGNIVSTNVTYSYQNSGVIGGGGMHIAESSINHIVDLLLQNTKISFIKVVAIETPKSKVIENETHI